MSDLSIDYDGSADVLYVKRKGAPIRHSEAHALDPSFIVNFDEDWEPVGIQLVDASQWQVAEWFDLAQDLPDSLRYFVAGWLLA
jgi:uncharacterized protein YuzE